MAKSVFTVSGAIRVNPNDPGQQAVRSPIELLVGRRPTVDNAVRHVKNSEDRLKPKAVSAKMKKK
jgi:hypothetical protein